MTLANEVKKLRDTKAFYAAAGAGDLAVEKLREVPDRLQRVQGRLEGIRRVDPKDLSGLSNRAVAYAGTLGQRATETYEELANRGRTVVNRVRGQEATQELEAEARTTVRRARTTASSAKQTAGSAKKAAGEGAKKVG